MLSLPSVLLLSALPGLVFAAPSGKRDACKTKATPSLNNTQHLSSLPQNITGDGLVYANHTWALNATYFGANPNDSDWQIYSAELIGLIANETANATLASNASATSTNLSAASTSLAAVNLAAVPTDAQAWVDAHNAARKQYGAEPVTWNEAAAAAAKANFETNKQTCQLEHTRTGFGQNLIGGSGEALTPQEAVDTWMTEADTYDPSNPTGDGEDNALHFTAVVWKSTTVIGCYLGSCNNGDWYAACSYGPSSNVVGAFADNVGTKVDA